MYKGGSTYEGENPKYLNREQARRKIHPLLTDPVGIFQPMGKKFDRLKKVSGDEEFHNLYG